MQSVGALTLGAQSVGAPTLKVKNMGALILSTQMYGGMCDPSALRVQTSEFQKNIGGTFLFNFAVKSLSRFAF